MQKDENDLPQDMDDFGKALYYKRMVEHIDEEPEKTRFSNGTEFLWKCCEMRLKRFDDGSCFFEDKTSGNNVFFATNGNAIVGSDS